MPTATDELSVLKTIGEWRQFARDEVDNIGGWRDADKRRLADERHRIWYLPHKSLDGLPWNFNTQTIWLASYVMEHYPKLDPSPINAICDAVMNWYKDRDAGRIPEQKSLESTLDNALRIVCAVEVVIEKRIHERKTGPTESPKDLIRITIAVQRYHVSRTTVQRLIDEEEIKSYRPANAPETSPHIVSEKDIADRYPKRRA